MILRRICSVIAFTLILGAVSCSSRKTDILDYQSGLREVSVEWEYGVAEYSANITFDGDAPADPEENRSATVSFTSPEEITGLAVRYTKDGAEASVGKVKQKLPEGTGEELYLVVRLFTLYPEELAEEKGDTAKFRSVINGAETEFDVTYKAGVPTSAKISWDTDEINIRRITIK